MAIVILPNMKPAAGQSVPRIELRASDLGAAEAIEALYAARTKNNTENIGPENLLRQTMQAFRSYIGDKR
jgi:hypothetical protein